MRDIGEYRIPCKGGLGVGVDGDEIGVDEGVFASFIAFDIVFKVVGACGEGVARVFECGVGAIAKYPAIFIAVLGGVVDVDSEGFASFERVETGVETGNGLFVDIDNNCVACGTGDFQFRNAVDGLYYIGGGFLYSANGFDGAGCIASGFPDE